MNLRSPRIVVSVALLVGMTAGFVLSNVSRNAVAATAFPVDQETLTDLYRSIFNRPLDSGADFHIGRNLKMVLHDISNSSELRYYGALFKAVKSYEEAQRSPGQLTAEEKQKHLDLIESALSTLIAWVETLPDQDPCRATITPEQAREAIRIAYEQMNSTAQEKAQFGIFNALKRIGLPSNIDIQARCLSLRSPSPSPTTSPLPTVIY